MRKGTPVFYVEEQNQYGVWEPTGEAFLSEQKCRDRVMDLDIEWIMKNISPMDIRVKALSHLSEEQVEEMSFSEIEVELRKLEDPRDIYELMENESLGGQCGGFYSYENLTLEDGAEENDGIDISSRRHTG